MARPGVITKALALFWLLLSSAPTQAEDTQADAALWSQLTVDGVAAIGKGAPEAALADFERSLEIAESFDEGDLRLATSHNNLGFALHSLGRFDEALQAYGRALTLRQDKLGRAHPLVAQTLNNLAEANRHKGRLTLAIDQHREALKIRQETLGEGHADTMQSQSNLGITLAESGALEEAIEQLKTARDTSARFAGAEHASSLDYNANLASLHYKAGDYNMATRLFAENVASLRKEKVSSERMATGLINLATSLAAMRRYQEALPLLQEARALTLEHRGGPTARRAKIEHDLGTVFFALGRLSEAELYLNQALATKRSLYEAGSDSIVPSLLALAQLHLDKADLAKAGEAIAEARSMLDEQSDTELVMQVATSLNNLGASRFKEGDYQAAARHLEEALKLEESHREGDSKGMIATLRNYAAILLTMERTGDAQALLERAAQIEAQAREKL